MRPSLNKIGSLTTQEKPGWQPWPCHNVQTLSTFLLQVLYAFCLFLFTFLSRARKKHLKCSLELLKFISMFSFPFFYASTFRWDDWCDRNVCMGGVFLSWASNDPGRSEWQHLGHPFLLEFVFQRMVISTHEKEYKKPTITIFCSF